MKRRRGKVCGYLKVIHNVDANDSIIIVGSLRDYPNVPSYVTVQSYSMSKRTYFCRKFLSLINKIKNKNPLVNLY